MQFDFVFNHFFVPVSADVLKGAELIQGRHDPVLVILSGIVAIVCAYIAFFAVRRSRVATHGRALVGWMCVASGTMGVGIWAMHFIGMLSFELPMQVEYDPVLTVASIVPSLVASMIALSIMRLRRATPATMRLLSAVLMAGGIGAMHFTGMAAMHLNAAMYYDGVLVIAAVLVAVLLAWIALSLPGYLSGPAASRMLNVLAGKGIRRSIAVRAMSAIGLGYAVTGMHYTAMAAVMFLPEQHADVGHDMWEPAFLAVWVMMAVALMSTAVIAVVFASKQRMHSDRLEAEMALRRRVEAAVDEQRARLQAIIDNVVEGIITFNSKGTIQHWSPAAQTLFGYSEEEVTGQNVGMLMAETLAEGELLERGEPQEFGLSEFRNSFIAGRETTGLRKDGSTFPLDLSIGYGEVKGKPFYTAVVRDLTQRKKELALLEEARDRAELAVKAKSEFLANMSHEIRTPMNGVLGFVGLALEKNNLNEETRAYLKTAQKSANNLLVIIDDILDFSRLESGRITLEKVPFDLRRLVGETAESLSLLAADKSLSLAVRIDDDVPATVKGDPVRIRQILINLISNAIKFTHHGGVSLSVTRSTTNREQLLFAVMDTGIGMSAETLSRVLQPFEQADSSTHRLYGGTGLGTTISLQLAQLHGGELWAESEEGKGSTFYFTANLTETENTEVEDITAPINNISGGRRAAAGAICASDAAPYHAPFHPREKAQGADRETLRKMFEDLYRALDADNPDPVEQVLDEMSFVLDRRFVSQMRKSVSQFDFANARQTADLMLDDLRLR